MGAYDLGAVIWPDAGQGRLPSTGPADVDPSISISRGLAFVIARAERDVVSGLLRDSGTITNLVGTRGLAAKVSASARWQNHGLSGSDGAGDFTLLSFSAPVASTVAGALVSSCSGLGGSQVYLFSNTNTSFYQASGELTFGGGGSGGSAVQMSAGVVIDGKPHVFVGIRKAGVGYIDVDGKQVATAALNSTSIANSGVVVRIEGIEGYSGWTDASTPHYLEVGWNRALTNAERVWVASNLDKLFAEPTLGIFAPSVGTGVQNLAATATAQATATANISKGVSVAAAALSVASGTAGMSLSVPLAAAATGQASSSGQISLSVTFAANALATALASAGLTLAKPLAAAAAGQATGTAMLGGAANLAANAQAQATGSATLSLAINLSAAAVAQATATADLGGSAVLAAAAIANAQATAALAVGKPLAATAQAQASAGATLWLDVQLNAAALAQATASGTLSLTVTLAAAALGNATSSASLPMAVLLAANGVAVATGGATLQVSGPLVGAATLVARESRRGWTARESRRAWVSRRE